MTWDDFSFDEKQALERLFTGNSVPVPRVTADRLISLGLADQRSGSVGISLAGEDLVAQHCR